MTVNVRVITERGLRGTLIRDFHHLSLDIEKIGKHRVQVRKWFGVHKELTAFRTVCSHIQNMINGVTRGYRYKMRSVYAHFPINTVIQDMAR